MLDIDKDHIERVKFHKDGITKNAQRLSCSVEGCNRHYNLLNNGRAKPVAFVNKAARNAGWVPDFKKGKHLCPAHAHPTRTNEEETTVKAPAKAKPAEPETVPEKGLKRFIVIDPINGATPFPRRALMEAWVKELLEADIGADSIEVIEGHVMPIKHKTRIEVYDLEIG